MNNLWTVFKKELTDILRDKKTLAFTIILPILIYPIMFKVMGYAMDSSKKDAEKEIKLVVEGNTDSNLVNLLKEQDNITIEDKIEDPKKALKDGDIQVIVNIPEKMDESIKNNQQVNLELLIDDQSNKSTIASSMVKTLVEQYSKIIVEGRLTSIGVDSSIITPISVEEKSGVSDDGEMNPVASMLMGMLPAMLVIMLLAPTMGLASDIGAGEKERGTFEPLLSTSANRSSILWGKILSISVISAIALTASMISLIISFKDYAATLSGENVALSISGKSIALTMVLALFMIITVATMQIGISIYARSTKEANTYLSGLMMPMMILAFIPMYMDVKSLNEILFHVPVMNAVVLIKEFFFGIYNISHIVIVLVWHLVYVGVVTLAAKCMFSKEEVIFRS